MIWIAPSERDTDNGGLERRLWDTGTKAHELGLEGEIKHGGNINSYYDDPHDATGRFPFGLAKPPFNVNAVDIGVRGRRNREPESIYQASTGLVSQSPSRHV